MKIEKELQLVKEKVDNFLADFFSRKMHEVKSIDNSLAELVEAVADLTLRGGKRIRPAFCLLGYESVEADKTSGKRKYWNNILAVACSLELFQSFALIHDDIIDKARIRRGGLAVQRMLNSTSAAILAGDLAFAWTDELFEQAVFKKKNLDRARIFFNQLKKEVIYGQYLDLANWLPTKANEDRSRIAENEILKIYEYKTARYTVEKPLLIGAALAGAEEKLMRAFSQYGIAVGKAFQIKDDLLSIFALEEVVGKSPKTDFEEGKKTLVLIKTIEKLRKRRKEKTLNRLSGLLGKKIDNKDFRWIKEIIEETGARRYCEQQAKKLIREGKKILRQTSLSAEAKKKFFQLADYLVERDY